MVSVYGAHLHVQAAENTLGRTTVAAPPTNTGVGTDANDPPVTAAPTAILAAKRRLRARALGRRDAAASGAEGADAAAGSVRDRFFDAFAAELGRTPPPAVSGYWPMQGELDVLPLLSGLCGRGIACALPAVIERGAALAFRAWRPGDGLVAGVFGTREPAPEAAPVIPGIVIAPLLAFDEAGNRLGYGGGVLRPHLGGAAGGGRGDRRRRRL